MARPDLCCSGGSPSRAGTAPSATGSTVPRAAGSASNRSRDLRLGALGPARRAEKARLQYEHARSLRVLHQIDFAASPED